MRPYLIRQIAKILRQRRRINLTDGVIARSMSMGMVIGFSPTVGLQMVICVILCFLVNALLKRHYWNLVIAVIGSLVVNPLTMLPTYTLYYFIGCQVISCPDLVEFESASQIEQMLYNLGDGAYAILLGSVPFMVVGLPLGYWLGRLIERFLERRAARKQARRERVARRRALQSAEEAG